MEQKSVEKMGSQPIKKLMVSIGLPVVISMMLQALYNIVDSLFISRMAEGESALHALTLAFPVQMLMVAIGIGTGVGVNVLLAKSMGQGNREKAARVAGNGYFLGIVITLVFVLFGMFGVSPYIASQTDDSLVLDMGIEYLRICCVGSAGIVLFNISEKLLQSTGLTVHSTIAQISGAVTNIVLDPILIFGLLGLPAMGAAGAAWATVIGQFVSFLLGLTFHMKVNKSVPKGIAYMKPQKKLIGEIYAVGLPAIIAQALMSVMTYGINLILHGVSDALVTAYGLYYKIQQFVLFAAFGLRDTITPIVSFGYGMKSRERIRDGMKYGVLDTFIIMAAGTILLELLANPLCAAFHLSQETGALCTSAIRIISLSFVFAGVSISLQGVFQALNCGISSLIISLCRQLVLVLPVAWGFAQIVGTNVGRGWIVWLTFPIAEVLTAAIALGFMSKAYKNKVKSL